jgi:hypothetical protein
MLSNFKKRLSDKMEELATDIIMGTDSVLMWREVDIPECLYGEIKEKKQKLFIIIEFKERKV